MANLSGILLALFAACVYGIFPPSAKLSYAHGANAVFLILLTTFFRAFFLGCFSVWRGHAILPEKGKVKVVVESGLYQSVSICSILMSLRFIPGPIMIIILFSHTMMLLFFMAFKGELKLTRSAIVTTVVALLGLSFVLDIWSQSSNLSMIGVCLAFIAAIATFNRLYIFGKQTIAIPPPVVGTQTFAASFIFLWVLLFYETPRLPTDQAGVFWVVVCCLSLALGSLGMFYGIAKLGSFHWSLFSKVEPIFTSIFSALLMNEILSLHQYLGISLVLGSLIIYQVVEHRTKADPIEAILTEPADI